MRPPRSGLVPVRDAGSRLAGCDRLLVALGRRAAIGLPSALAFSSAALCAGTVVAGIYALRGRRGAAPERDEEPVAAG